MIQIVHLFATIYEIGYLPGIILRPIPIARNNTNVSKRQPHPNDLCLSNAGMTRSARELKVYPGTTGNDNGKPKNHIDAIVARRNDD